MSTPERRSTERLPLGWVESFRVEGEARFLVDPHGPPTGRQLLALWHDGMLAIVGPDPVNGFTKAEAAWAIDWARGEGS